MSTDRMLDIERRAVAQTSNSVLGMLLFVISESMFFMGFFAVYASAYATHTVWPPPAIHTIPSSTLPTVDVLVLVASFFTMAQANLMSRLRRDRAVLAWMAATLTLAIAFVVIDVFTYRGLGFSTSTGIWGSLFWSLSIIALAHAVGGVVFFVLVLTRVLDGEIALRRDPLQSATIYWNFVAAIGVVFYLLFYAANVAIS